LQVVHRLKGSRLAELHGGAQCVAYGNRRAVVPIRILSTVSRSAHTASPTATGVRWCQSESTPWFRGLRTRYLPRARPSKAPRALSAIAAGTSMVGRFYKGRVSWAGFALEGTHLNGDSCGQTDPPPYLCESSCAALLLAGDRGV
jgi:hypothetical protein